MFWFSIFGFYQLNYVYTFNQDSQTQQPTDNVVNYNETLFQTFISTLNNGLRLDGGIGDAITKLKITDKDYWVQYTFNLLFFVVVNILLL